MLPLFLAGVVFMVLAPVFWTGSELPQSNHLPRSYENADLYHRVYPSICYGFSRLSEGALPLWNPQQLCGTPFLAALPNALFQPLNIPFLVLDTEQAMAVQAFLSLFLMGAFFVLYARALPVRYVPAIIGGMVYAFSGASAAAMSRPELAAALAWTPLLFWAIRAYTRSSRYAPAMVGGIAGGMLILSGSVAATAAMAILAVPYAALRAVVPGQATPASLPKRLLTGFPLMAVVALGLSAVQWAPASVWCTLLDAPGEAVWRLDAAGVAPARLRDLLAQFLVAEPGVLPRMGYVGIATLLIVPAAFFHRAARGEAIFFAAAALILFPAAVLGRATPAASFSPAGLLFPAVFSIAVLAALGADRSFGTGRNVRSPLTWGPPLVVLLTAVGLFYIGSANVRGRIVLLTLLLLAFLIFRLRWVGALCGLIAAAVLFVDLSTASVNNYQHPYADAFRFYSRYTEALKTAEEQALGGRILVSAHPLNKAIPANLGMVSAAHDAGGARLPLTADQARWWAHLLAPGEKPSALARLDISPEANCPALINHMAVRVFLISDDSPLASASFEHGGARLRRLRKVDGLELYVNDAALPRAYWVPSYRTAEDVEAATAILSGPDFDFTQECVVEGKGRAVEQLAALVPEAPGVTRTRSGAPSQTDWEVVACTIEDESPERVTLRVEAPQPGIAVLADTFDIGWTATLDGVAAPILKANGIFRGVAAPAGTHIIVFEYHPRSVWLGLGISLTCLGVLVLAGVAGLIRHG